MTNQIFRQLTARERGLVKQLTAPNFIGSDRIREQLEACEARTIDDEGSFELRINNPSRAHVFYRVPVELEANDRDGVRIHVLLHVVDGIAKEVEVYKDSPEPIAAWPSHWDVVVS